MSKKEKKPLSKAVGEWDNGYINTPKIDYTLGQLESAFRAYPKYKKLLNSDRLRIVLRGSPKKNSANSDLADIDVQAVFMGKIDINAEKNDVFNAMIAYFKFEDVQRKSKAICRQSVSVRTRRNASFLCMAVLVVSCTLQDSLCEQRLLSRACRRRR